MTSDDGTPAAWYEDPSGVGELRYFDGTRWTEHVVIDGVQTTSPLESGPVEGVAGASMFIMRRAAQWRSEAEKPVEVTGPAGPVGQFVTLLDGAPGYRLVDPDGATIINLSKPSLKAALDLTDPAGYAVGTVTKVGRLHSRYDVTTQLVENATVKLVAGSDDEWDVHVDGNSIATVARTTTSAADALNFAGADYTTTFSSPVDESLTFVVLAIPMAIDMLDTQALAR